MSKKLSLILILCLLAMVLLVSCQRAASKSPIVKPTATHAGGLATQPVNGLGSVQIIGTQTALAKAALTGSPTPNGSTALATSTPFGTPAVPNTFTLVPPTGGAPTLAVSSTPLPGTTPIIIVPTATPGRPATYTLMQGEFPYCIARRFNVNPDDLLALNGFTQASAQALQPGQMLKIPQSGSFPGVRALHTHPTTYTVAAGDMTIYGVACFFGDVDPTQIIAANSLTSPYALHFNQVLNIP